MRTLNRRDPKNATHARTHGVIHGVLLADKFWTAPPKSHPSSLPLRFRFELYQQLKRLHNRAPTEGPCHHCGGRGATVGPCCRCRSCLPAPANHLDPKLFIWLFLSATSVSSVHLCPLWKMKKKKIKKSPPTQKSMSLWAMCSFGMTTNKIGPN